MSEYVVGTGNSLGRTKLTGKAANLFRLQDSGLPVPEFICLSTLAYAETIAPIVEELRQLLIICDYANYQQLSDTSLQAKALVNSCKWTPVIQESLNAALDSMPECTHYSVRSSAALEDGASHSFAGQLATFLNVRRGEIGQSIFDCWASAFEPGVLTYLHRMGLDPLRNEVAVVVQLMIKASSSGVLFQADPRGGVHQSLIVAGYGLGEGIVSDKVESDLYIWDKLADKWSIEINPKTCRIVTAAGGGTCIQPLPPELCEHEVLSEEQRNELMDSSATIASLYDHYQDVEWLFDENGKLYILQSRPITTIPKGANRAFDSSNIAESYPGCISPLTFSLVRRDYYYCLQGALKYFGVPEALLQERDHDLRHLVGYINGRAFYSINNWYRILLLSPFFKSRIIRYFDKMIGTEGSYSATLDDSSVRLSHRLKIAVSFPLAVGKAVIFHDRIMADYFVKAQKLQKNYLETDLQYLSADELIGYLDKYTKQYLRLLSIPILNDFLTMIFMFSTSDLFKSAGIEDAEEYLNHALAHQGLESSKPVRLQQEMSKLVGQSENLRNCLQTLLQIESRNYLECISAYLIEAGFENFAHQFGTYVALYGHRSPKELILEADTFREDPYAMLRVIVQSSMVCESRAVVDHSVASGNEFFDLDSRLHGFRWKRPLGWLLGKTRNAISHRETTRLDRGLHFAFFRTIVREIGERMQSDGLLVDAEEVFLLTLDELDDYRMGCTPNADLKGLVAYRQSQYQDWLAKDPQERLFTSGAVYGNTIPDRSTDKLRSDQILLGTGCSEGIVTGYAAVIKDPGDATDLEGKILVAQTTDPGWVFIMTMSLGLVAERGSLLSHTAIIGRELGIPTVVGVKNATRLIKDGALITINGKSGEVQLVCDVPTQSDGSVSHQMENYA